MHVVIDIEANSLNNPTQIWLIVCKDIATGKFEIFRNVTSNAEEKARFLSYSTSVSCWIGHNFLGYDYPHLHTLIGLDVPDIAAHCIDTFIVSKLIDYSRKGHSIEDYGEEFGNEKIKFNDWTKWSKEMEDYCVRDVDICHQVYRKYAKYIGDPKRQPSILLEHRFQLLVNSLHVNGFSFDTDRAGKLLARVNEELAKLDKEIEEAFPPKLRLVREITPRTTQHGTLNKADFRFVKDGDLSEYNGGPFCRCSWVPFNPASHKQIIEVLNHAGWRPEEKTQAHIDTEREINVRRRTRSGNSPSSDTVDILCKLETLKLTGWKINEHNLATLPKSAPSPARTLAKRILLESRRRTLTEWLNLVREDNRIHGDFMGIGAWTQRMAHQKPNTANIPSPHNLDGSVKLLGKEMRSLWRVPRNRLLVGVDAEGIQLRIFAHYIDDPEFTQALVKGKKDDKSDPHSLNQRILGSVCKTRAAAKRFIYALLLGAGLGKLSQILGCSESEAKLALARLLERYQGFAHLKEHVIPKDARRGWFEGLDGRAVSIPGDTVGSRSHLCMSGYLQNGEAVVMKKAAILWHQQLHAEEQLEEWKGKLKDWLFVNMVHDEWQTECANDLSIAKRIAQIQADSLRLVGEELNLKCPLAGSYWNEDNKDYTIGINWYQTH
jgi:DNA polymerase-1